MAERAALLDIIELTGRHGLHLTPTGARVDESGADFRVVHLADEAGVEWIIRVPRRPDAFERSRVEKRILEVIRPRLRVAVPEWRIHSPEIIAYPRLNGEPAAIIDTEAGGYVWRFDASRPPARFVESLGDAVASLHAIQVNDAVAAAVRSLTPDEVRASFAGRIERFRTMLRVPEVVAERWARWLEDDECWPRHSVLVHGDLHPPHVLVDGAGEVVGMIDWSEAHVGDPATDFGLFYATMGRESLEAIVGRYGTAGGRVWPRMVDHIAETWAAYPLTIAEFALATGEQMRLQLAQHLIDATAAEMAESGGDCVRPGAGREGSSG